jgi:hypothetical protein
LVESELVATPLVLIMRRLFWSAIVLTALSTGAQTGGVFLRAPTNAFTFPLTNQLAFTNSLGLTNDFSAIQMADLAALLLGLQTNVEETLPVLSFMTSNATVEISSAQNPQAAAPVVPGPASPFLPPTGRTNPAEPTLLAVPLGTNTVLMDQSTFQGVATLQNDLAALLPVLQALNGTTVTNVETNGENITAAFTNDFPAMTNFSPGVMNNGFVTPLTNQSRILSSPGL